MVKNILVLDDNKNDLLMAKFVIMRMGFQPILIDKSTALIETLQTQSVSLIVLDLDMPGLTGIEVLKRIKRVPSYKDIPVVMLTGHSEAAQVRAAISLGAADYIVKPIDPMVFESKVKKLIEINQTISQNDWVEYEIKKSQNGHVKLFFSAQVFSIGELGLTLKSDYALPAGFTFFSEAELFDELEIKAPPLKVETSTAFEGGFLIKCALLGLSESELKKIRLYSQLLMRHAGA